MTREDIENDVGYWQEKANLEYIRQRQEHGVNDPYMIIEIDEAFDAGFDKGYQHAVEHSDDVIRLMVRIAKKDIAFTEEEAVKFYHETMEE